jgi:hypothetical protein
MYTKHSAFYHPCKTIMDLSSAFATVATAANVERAAAGLAPIEVTPLEEAPDVPACGSCDAEGAGTQVCQGCRLASYCSRACQIVHWKKGGHKAACPTMAAESQETGARVVAMLKDTRRPPAMRVLYLCDLDDYGPYRCAVKAGLYAALRDVLRDDIEVMRNRDAEQLGHSYLHAILMVLFRGQRISRSSTSFTEIDGGRIKSFLRSDPQAAELLWTAGMMCVGLPVDEKFARKEPDLRDELWKKAWDVLLAFTMIFINDRSSKELLQLAHGQERATWLVRELQPALTSVTAPHELDPSCVLEDFLKKIAALIAYRCRVDDTAPFVLDVVQILGLQG